MTKIKELVAQLGGNAGDAPRRRGDYDRHVEQLGKNAAGWHGPDDIETLTGLAGSFQWFENPTNPAVITFRFTPGHEGSEGTYQLIGGRASESGEFGCVPNNPAIGWAFIVLSPTGGQPRVVDVTGMLTDADWVISVALLNPVGDKGPVYPPFAAIRLTE